MTVAYHKGYKAFLHCISLEYGNPYEHDTKNYFDWRNGWNDAYFDWTRRMTEDKNNEHF